MLPTSWRRLLSLIRILLAMSCLTIQLISSSFAWTDTAILFAVYIIYACVALFWRSLEDSGYPTLALIWISFSSFCRGHQQRDLQLLDQLGLLRLRAARGGDAAHLVEDSGGCGWRHRAAVRGARRCIRRRCLRPALISAGILGMRARHPARVSGRAALERIAADRAVPLRRGKGARDRNGSASPPIFTMARCRASSAFRCGWRSFASCCSAI